MKRTGPLLVVVLVVAGAGLALTVVPAGADDVTETFNGGTHYVSGGAPASCPAQGPHEAVVNGQRGLFSYDNCTGTTAYGGGSVVFYATGTSVTAITYAGGSDGGDCEFYFGPYGGSASYLGNKHTWANGAWTTRTYTLTTGAMQRYTLSWGIYNTANAYCGVTSLGLVGHGSTTTTTSTTTTSTTTTSTTTTTTTTIAPSPEVEDFDQPPFKVSPVPNTVTPLWDSTREVIFSSSPELDSGGWTQGMAFSAVAQASPVTMKLTGAGFGRSSGCEVYLGDGAGTWTFTGEKVSNTSRTIALAVTAGTRFYVRLGHDGATATGAGSTCSVDDVGPIQATISGTPIDPWTDPVDDDSPDVGTTGEDGLDDCVPAGWSAFNPFSWIGGMGCVLRWAFVPDGDALSVAALRESAEGKVPFSWIEAFADLGPAVQATFDPPSDCWVDLGRDDGLDAEFGTDSGSWDDKIFGQGNCGNGPWGDGASQYGAISRAIFSVLIWVGLGVRLLRAAPWSKGKDGGGAGMIVEKVFQVIVAAVSAILDLLPETPVPPNLAGKFTTAFGGIDWAWAALSDWFPVGELGAALAGLIAFAVAIHVVRLVAWVLALVHIGGTDAA